MFEMGTEAWAVIVRDAPGVRGRLRRAPARRQARARADDGVRPRRRPPDLERRPGFDGWARLLAPGGLLAALTLLAINRVVAELRLRGGLWGRLIGGRRRSSSGPSGDRATSGRKGLAPGAPDGGSGARDRGSPRDALAVLETDGSISIVPMTSPRPGRRSTCGRSPPLRIIRSTIDGGTWARGSRAWCGLSGTRAR